MNPDPHFQQPVKIVPDLIQVEAIVKESKETDVLNKRLAELVAKDWKEITLASLEEIGASLSEDEVDTTRQNGSTFLQPNCFHNLSHCSLCVTPAKDVWKTKEVELEERLEDKDINMSNNSKEHKEIERKRRLTSSSKADMVRKRRKNEAKPEETSSQSEAEKMLLSIVGTDDPDNVLKIMSSLSQSFDFRSSSANGSRCNIPKDSLLELASLEESFVEMKKMYPSPYSSARSSGVVELRCETTSLEEEQQQEGEARLKEQLAKDGDLEKYIRGKEKLIDQLKKKKEEADCMDLRHREAGAGSEVEEEENQREEARLKEQLAKDGDFEKYQRERRKFLELKQKRKDEIEDSGPLKNGAKVVLEQRELENQGGLTEVERVQKELALAKDKLSKDKDVKEYKREKKMIFRRALDRLGKQLSKDGNMKSYLAEKELIDRINYT